MRHPLYLQSRRDRLLTGKFSVRVRGAESVWFSSSSGWEQAAASATRSQLRGVTGNSNRADSKSADGSATLPAPVPRQPTAGSPALTRKISVRVRARHSQLNGTPAPPTLVGEKVQRIRLAELESSSEGHDPRQLGVVGDRVDRLPSQNTIERAALRDATNLDRLATVARREIVEENNIHGTVIVRPTPKPCIPFAPSFNSRTSGSDPADRGANPRGAIKRARRPAARIPGPHPVDEGASPSEPIMRV